MLSFHYSRSTLHSTCNCIKVTHVRSTAVHCQFRANYNTPPPARDEQLHSALITVAQQSESARKKWQCTNVNIKHQIRKNAQIRRSTNNHAYANTQTQRICTYSASTHTPNQHAEVYTCKYANLWVHQGDVNMCNLRSSTYKQCYIKHGYV